MRVGGVTIEGVSDGSLQAPPTLTQMAADVPESPQRRAEQQPREMAAGFLPFNQAGRRHGVSRGPVQRGPKVVVLELEAA